MLAKQNIQVLDVNTANQIAAGEVVEKPASVVKELVENALDAGADKIEVKTFAGGTEYIRVVDNGSGMSEENARLAILRHATSKIVAADDLLSLHTLGFRGEALPSIASVSNFTLLTRPATEEFATSIHIDGGEQVECSSTGANAGTTVIVENLFFNVPARRKFLKTVGTEGRYISELLTKLALSRPDVSFNLVNNDKEVLRTPGAGDLKETIRALYGKQVSEELLQVDFTSPEVSIKGYISKPTLLKGTRQWQSIFVNGRLIGNKMLAKAIDHAYQSQIPKSGFPFVVLNLTLDTAAIDVNVHPQKSEIKFSDEGTMYKAMFKALTDALTRPMHAIKTEVSLLEDSELQSFLPQQGQSVYTPPVQPAAAPTPVPKPVETSFAPEMFDVFKTPEPQPLAEKPAATAAPGSSWSAVLPQASAVASGTAPASQAQPVVEQVGREQPAVVAEPLTPAQDQYQGRTTPLILTEEQQSRQLVQPETIAFTDTDSGIDTIWPIGQVDKTFIIAQSETSLYLIDQHAAHERILYDKLVASHNNIPAQQLLIPLYVDVQPQDLGLLEEHRQEFLRLGVDVEPAGETMLRVSSLPADIKAEDAEDFILEISKMLREMRTIQDSDLRQEVLHMTACKAAIKAGQLLNTRQMRQLIIDLCNTTHPFTCPHGRPCMIEINSDELYKMFKRTGF